MIEITVYGKPGCHQCKATTKKLGQLEVPFIYSDVTEDERHADVVRFLGYQQLPVVLAGDLHWSGYSPDRLQKLADIIHSDEYDRMETEYIELEVQAVEYIRKEFGR